MKNFKLEEVLKKVEGKRDIYVSLIQNTYGTEKDTADNIFTSELEAFSERMKTYYNEQFAMDQKKNTGLPTLTELQGTNIFLEVMQMGLSFAPAAGMLYVSRLKGTGTAVGYQITAKGEIFLAQKSGAIDYVTDPVIVRNDEKFKIVSAADGSKFVEHEISFESQESFNFEKNYKCGYVYLVYPNGDKDLRWVDKSRMEKARSMSPSKALYNDISFLQTKVLRRALRNVRKVSFLMSMHSQADIDDVIEDVVTEVNEVKEVKQTNQNEVNEVKQNPTSNLTQGLDLNFDV